jgi:hypothetical protein
MLNKSLQIMFCDLLQSGLPGILRIPLIPPPDSEGIRHPVPIQVARVFRLIPPPLVGA